MLRKMIRKPRLERPDDHGHAFHKHWEKAVVHEAPSHHKPKRHDED